MIAPEWKRIAGLHSVDDGTLAVTWLAHDTTADVLHLYDATKFHREVWAVIVEGIKQRGGWIPLAWENDAKDVAEELLSRGVNTITEPVKDKDTLAEVTARDIWERMRSGRFKVGDHLSEWLAEYEKYHREGQKIPRDPYPLMTATRHAVARLDWARRKTRGKSVNYPKVATV